MAFGAALLSLPTAVLGTAWVALLHNLTVMQSFGLYVTLGFLTLLTALSVAVLAQDN